MKVDYIKPLYKRVQIKDKTKRVLKNGKVVPTFLASERELAKLMR